MQSFKDIFGFDASGPLSGNKKTIVNKWFKHQHDIVSGYEMGLKHIKNPASLQKQEQTCATERGKMQHAHSVIKTIDPALALDIARKYVKYFDKAIPMGQPQPTEHVLQTV